MVRDGQGVTSAAGHGLWRRVRCLGGDKVAGRAHLPRVSVGGRGAYPRSKIIDPRNLYIVKL